MELATLWTELGLPGDYAAARGLAPQIEANPATLVTVATPAHGRPIRLTPAAAAAWTMMRDAASADGISLIAVSGFRSVARQAEIFREHLAAGRALPDILRLVAAPGFSEHHTGRAVDITAPDDPPLEAGFALTPAFRWLDRSAAEFGFTLSFPRHNPHGIAYEPWHWLWHPAR